LANIDARGRAKDKSIGFAAVLLWWLRHCFPPLKFQHKISLFVRLTTLAAAALLQSISLCFALRTMLQMFKNGSRPFCLDTLFFAVDL
jgi:hypothetical protein